MPHDPLLTCGVFLAGFVLTGAAIGLAVELWRGWRQRQK